MLLRGGVGGHRAGVLLRLLVVLLRLLGAGVGGSGVILHESDRAEDEGQAEHEAHDLLHCGISLMVFRRGKLTAREPGIRLTRIEMAGGSYFVELVSEDIAPLVSFFAFLWCFFAFLAPVSVEAVLLSCANATVPRTRDRPSIRPIIFFM